MITITEALAELKLIKSKIEKKQGFILGNIGRQEGAKDQFVKDGGTEAVIEREMQAVRDLQERIVRIRSSIAAANTQNSVDILGSKRSIADWLVWRREVAPLVQDMHNKINQGLKVLKDSSKRNGFTVVSPGQQPTMSTDVIVSLDERKLADSSERTQEILDTLDGKLSLHNATVQVNAD